MKTILSAIGAVVLAASNLFASVEGSDVFVGNSHARISYGDTSNIPDTAYGRHVYIPLQKLLDKEEALKISFEVYRSDGVNTYDMSRLNFMTCKITCLIVQNNEVSQTVSSLSSFAEFASTGALYSNEQVSPAVNKGMLIIPYDSNGQVITSLVGTRIKDPSPYSMNGGQFLVHSVPTQAVHKVKIVDMPFKPSQNGIAILKQVKVDYPNRPLSMIFDVSVNVHLALNVQNGCQYFPNLFTTNGKCWVNFDGALKPSTGFNNPSLNSTGTALSIPAGSLSWLDLYESSTPSGIGSKVNLNSCSFAVQSSRSSIPPPPDSLVISGLSTNESRKFYTLRVRE